MERGIMSGIRYLAFVLSLVTLTTALAQTSESSSSIAAPSAATSTLPMPRGLSNKKFDDDKEITDARIRAMSGSVSRYSAKFDLNYAGPPLNDFSAKLQPNPDDKVNPKKTNIGGSIGTRYRLDKKSAIGLNVGIRALYPAYGIHEFETKDPNLNYDYTTRVGDIQMRNSIGFSYITNPDILQVGETSSMQLMQSLAYEIDNTRLFATIDTMFMYGFYDRGYVASPPGFKRPKKVPTRLIGDGNAQRYMIAVMPGMKFRYSDALSFFTSVGVSEWNPRSQDSSLVLWHNTIMQHIGLGWAVQRDIYLSPAIDIYPQALAFDTTTFSLSTIFSIL